MSDYLWDRTGPVDDDVARLEQTLVPLRYHRPLHLPAQVSSSRPYLALAAAVLIGVFAWWLHPGVPQQPSAWHSGGKPLAAGQRIRTGPSRQLLEAADFGEIRVEPDSELTIGPKHRMTLRQGRMHALIWAPPGQFVVDTPSAKAVDLGCQYELSVDGAGDGFLKVETGWVAFQAGTLESFIPAGAACRTSRATGPGIPFYTDASPAFLSALDTGDLSGMLGAARPKDSLSLWHLLARVEAGDRRKVFERFRELTPVQVDERRALTLDREALDECWNALNLDDVDWWRTWKRAWRQ